MIYKEDQNKSVSIKKNFKIKRSKLCKKTKEKQVKPMKNYYFRLIQKDSQTNKSFVIIQSHIKLKIKFHKLMLKAIKIK